MKIISVTPAFRIFSPIALVAESKVALDTLSLMLQASIKKGTAGAKVQSIAKEREDWQLQYEVDTALNRRSHNLLFSPNGDLFEIYIYSLPTPVSTAIQEKSSGGAVRSVEKVIIDKLMKTYYQVSIVSRSGRKFEYTVRPDGLPKDK